MQQQRTTQRVFITHRIMERGVELLRAQGYEVVMYDGAEKPIPAGILYEEAKKSDALISMITEKIDRDFLSANRHLKVIANYAVGYNNIDVQAASEFGIPVGNTPDVLSDATADLTIALILAVARRLPQAANSIREGTWKNFDPLAWIGQSLKNKTIGIIGMGRIGYQVARRCHFAWNMRVIYFSRHRQLQAEQKLGAKQVSNLTELLRGSDIISVHLPLSNETKGLINADAFAAMRPNAIFINTSRGEIVDHNALYETLKERKIFGAGLDVTFPEPLPPQDRLLNLDNLFITPHIGSADEDARQGMSLLAARNVIAALKGRKLPCLVNAAAYSNNSLGSVPKQQTSKAKL